MGDLTENTGLSLREVSLLKLWLFPPKCFKQKSTKVFIVAGVLREGILRLILMQWRHLSSKDLKLNGCW